MILMNIVEIFANAVRPGLLAAAALLSISPAQAHRMWLLPSTTVLSGAEAWVTVDAAVSNTLFVFEHRPLRLDGLLILAPGGKRLTAENPHTGRFRSSFDVKLDAQGTYRISIGSSSILASWMEKGELKRWRGAPEQMAAQVPAGAEGLKVSRMSTLVETYVTLGKPTQDVLAPKGAMLEILPVTHPNDLLAGEEAVFAVLMDGKPAAGVEVTVAQGSGRHIESPFEQRLRSDAGGRVRVRFPAPGYYWLQAATGAGGAAPGGDRATCVLTVEALPQ